MNLFEIGKRVKVVKCEDDIAGLAFDGDKGTITNIRTNVPYPIYVLLDSDGMVSPFTPDELELLD